MMVTLVCQETIADGNFGVSADDCTCLSSANSFSQTQPFSNVGGKGVTASKKT